MGVANVVGIVTAGGCCSGLILGLGTVVVIVLGVVSVVGVNVVCRCWCCQC